MITYRQVNLKLSPHARDRMTVIRRLLSAAAGRPVTVSETVEVLCDIWERTSALARDVKEHQG